MSLQIRNGDTVLVRGTVVGESGIGPKVAFNEVNKEDGCNTLWIEPRTVVSVEPRALQVGDRVRIPQNLNGWYGEIIGLHADQAWVKWESGVFNSVSLDRLRLAP